MNLVIEKADETTDARIGKEKKKKHQRKHDPKDFIFGL